MVQKISAVLVKAGKVTPLSVGMSLAFCILIGITGFFFVQMVNALDFHLPRDPHFV